MKEFRILAPGDPIGSYQVGETPQDAAYRFFLTWHDRLPREGPLALQVEWPPHTGQMTEVVFHVCKACSGRGEKEVGWIDYGDPELAPCPLCGGLCLLPEEVPCQP